MKRWWWVSASILLVPGAAWVAVSAASRDPYVFLDQYGAQRRDTVIPAQTFKNGMGRVLYSKPLRKSVFILPRHATRRALQALESNLLSRGFRKPRASPMSGDGTIFMLSSDGTLVFWTENYSEAVSTAKDFPGFVADVTGAKIEVLRRPSWIETQMDRLGAFFGRK